MKIKISKLIPALLAIFLLPNIWVYAQEAIPEGSNAGSESTTIGAIEELGLKKDYVAILEPKAGMDIDISGITISVKEISAFEIDQPREEMADARILEESSENVADFNDSSADDVSKTEEAILEDIAKENNVINTQDASHKDNINAAGTVDLTISNLRHERQTEPFLTSKPAQFQYDISNLGSADALRPVVNYYINNQRIGSSVLNNISPMTGKYMEVEISGAAAGTYSLSIRANEDHVIAEANYSNNTVSGQFTWASALSDTGLTAYAFYLADKNPEFIAGTSKQFVFSVLNSSARAFSDVLVKIEIFNGSTVVSANTLSIGELPAQNLRENVKFSIKFGQVGIFTIKMTVLPPFGYADPDLTDNTKSIKVTVKADTSILTATATGDIRVTGVATNDMVVLPVAMVVSHTTSLNYHLENQVPYGDKIDSTILYEKNVYSPEVCTYECEVTYVDFINSGTTDTFSANQITEGDYVYPNTHNLDGGYVRFNPVKKLASPTKIITHSNFVWSDNVYPVGVPLVFTANMG